MKSHEACLLSTQVDVSSMLGLVGEALILLFPLEVRRQSNSMSATLMGRSRMIYDIDGYVKFLSIKIIMKNNCDLTYFHVKSVTEGNCVSEPF